MPQPYNAPRRRAQAQATRRRVLDSAVLLFGAHGYSTATVGSIAEHAGVSERLVYSQFGSKRGLLMALLEHFAPAPSSEVDAALDQAGDPSAQLAVVVTFITDYYAAAVGVLRIALPAAAAEEDLGQFIEAGEHFRRLAQRPLVQSWSKQRALRPGLHAAEAGATLWVMTSPEVYLKFIAAGWEHARVRDWLTATLRRDLLDA